MTCSPWARKGGASGGGPASSPFGVGPLNTAVCKQLLPHPGYGARTTVGGWHRGRGGRALIGTAEMHPAVARRAAKNATRRNSRSLSDGPLHS